MLEITGKYTSAKIFTDTVEESAMSLIYGIINHPAFAGIPVRQMPDTHAGKGICIGFTAPLGDMVNPSHVGCDIGCTVTSIIYHKPIDKETYPLLEHKVRKAVPTGMDLQPKSIVIEKDFYKYMNTQMMKARSSWPDMVRHVNVDEKYIDALLKRVGQSPSVFWKSIATCGSGNHFLELGLTPEGLPVWTIHCGSRNLGQRIFKYWDKASKNTTSTRKHKEAIEKIKKETTDRTQIGDKIKAYMDEYNRNHPEGYLSGDDMSGYLTDLFFCQAYAHYNHEMIRRQISGIMLSMYGAKEVEVIQSTHNWIHPMDRIIRKGAIAAYEGEKIIIPFNMRDGLAICTGKSNPDWNYSAPHGAGRIMSRAQAKANISLDDFKETMNGVYSTSVCTGTLDESPMAYKDMQTIVDAIGDTCEILYFIKPEINIKATDGSDD